MTMMFDDTIKLYAAAAEDDHNFGDESEDSDLNHGFEDDEEEEVTMTSDDDDELGDDEDETAHGTKHAEDASILTPPPSPVRSYEPATKWSELPVKNNAETSVAKSIKSVKPAAKKKSAPAKAAAPVKKSAPAKKTASAKKVAVVKKAASAKKA